MKSRWLAVGLGLLLVGGALSFLSQPREPVPAQSSASVERVPRAPEPERDPDVYRRVQFFYAVQSSHDAARKACYQASRCGSVGSSLDFGDVGSAADIAPCLDERVPACDRALNTLRRSANPPEELRRPWSRWVEAGIEDVRNRAALLGRVVDEVGVPRTLRFKGEEYSSLLDWAYYKRVGFVRSALDERDVMADADARRAAFDEIAALLPGVFVEGHGKSMSKLMNGRQSIEPAYWRSPL